MDITAASLLIRFKASGCLDPEILSTRAALACPRLFAFIFGFAFLPSPEPGSTL